MDKKIPDNKTGAPFSYYQSRFALEDACALGRRSGVTYAEGRFSLRYLNRDIFLYWPDMKVRYAERGEAAGDTLAILLCRLVTEGRLAPWQGGFSAYTEMPWGKVYGVQFDGRCVKRLAHSFGRDIESFSRACKALGGIAVKKGDAAFDIAFINGLIVRLIVWKADEEFPPSAQILFSDNFPQAFTAEDMAVAGDLILSALKSAR
jgi:hypothetical protein